MTLVQALNSWLAFSDAKPFRELMRNLMRRLIDLMGTHDLPDEITEAKIKMKNPNKKKFKLGEMVIMNS